MIKNKALCAIAYRVYIAITSQPNITMTTCTGIYGDESICLTFALVAMTEAITSEC